MRFKWQISIISILILIRCASQTTPTGGPKDEDPPILISSNPSNELKNFAGSTIELTFDEYIKLKDPKEEILITPSPGKNTKFIVKKNKLIIDPEMPWQETTTYSINFREGVQDLTEGNPAENLRLAFSTGPTIDSLSIAGSVVEMFSEKTPLKITVALYQSDTFNIFNHTPIYFTKSNKEGKFSLQNLKDGKYYLYAFDDKNKNLKVESKTEKFGFIAKPIALAKNQDSLTVNLINVDTRPPAITSIRHTEKTTLVRFNKFVDSLHINVQNKSQTLYTFGESKSELIFYNSFDSADSLKVQLFASDSVQQTVDTTFFIKYSQTKMAKEGFGLKELSEKYNLATKEFNHQLSYNKPLSKINLDSIYIKTDSVNTTTLLQKNLTIDTLHHIISVNVVVEIKPDSLKSDKPSKVFQPFLRYGKGAFISLALDSSKSISKNIPIAKEDETGLITAKIDTQEKNYEIQIITTDNVVVQKFRNPKEISAKFLKPQEYKIRVLIDSNGNGKWDSGNFFRGIEPEKIFFYKSDEGAFSFPIRANWEYGPLVIKF